MKPARPKYQVFISSTYEDLRDEREHVHWEILKMRHIPAGMESFTAKNERGWKTIQRTIDDSDYYILILAGRYGWVDPDWQQSWTHHEYEYALSKGIPILVFLRDWSAIPASLTDSNREKIEAFRKQVEGKFLRSKWAQKDDLAKAVSTALTTQIQDDVDEDHQRPGWYRGDALPGTPPVSVRSDPSVTGVPKGCSSEGWNQDYDKKANTAGRRSGTYGPAAPTIEPGGDYDN